MNKRLDIHLKLIIFFLFVTIGCSKAQEQNITSYIQTIEQNSDYIFNYDVNQTDRFSLKSEIKNEYSLSDIKAFFEATPFEIMVKNKRIVLLPVQKKSYTLCGKVMSEEKEALGFANIIVGDSQGTSTDGAGNFELTINAYKNEICHISYLGYNGKSFRLDELLSCPSISLKSNDYLISNSIVIVSFLKKGIQEGRSYGGLDLNFKKRTNELTIYNQDVFQTLQQLPGITSPDDSAVNLNIRGGSPDHNLINWEGITLYDQGYLFGMISSINPYSLEKISVYKSNHNPGLDNKIGGVVNMYLPDIIPTKISTNLGFNLTETFGNVHIPVLKNKVSVLFSGRKSLQSIWENNPTYSSYTQKIFQSERIAENEINEDGDFKIDFHDINTKLIIQANDRLKFQSSLLTSSNQNDNISSFNSIDLSTSNAFSSSSTALSNRISYRLFNKDSIGIGHFYSRFNQESESEIDITKSDTIVNFFKREESNQIIDHQIRLNYTFGKNSNRSTIGYVFDKKSTELENEEYSTSQTETETSINASGTFHHLFAHHTFIKDKTLLEFGGRASYSQELSKTYFSPSLSFRYKLKEYLRLKTSAGIYYQFIRQVYEPIDNTPNLENAIWTLNVQKDSPVLNSKKMAAGLIFKDKGWLIDVEGYFHQTDGLAAQNPNVRNSIVVEANNELVSKGIDFLINKRIKQFSTSIFYSISENKVILPILEEMENEGFAANNNQLHQLKLLSSYQIKNLEVSLSYHFKSGLPFTDDVTIVEDEDEDDKYELEYENFNNKQFKDYHRVDLSMLYSNHWKNKNYEIGFSILNIFNRKNIGTKKSILTETNIENMTPEILEINKNLLPITFNFNARLYW